MANPTLTARDLLRAHGLKRTLARVSVLRHLLSATMPQSAAQIENAIAEHGFNPSTIYRTLVCLMETGLVVQREFGDRIWRFELRDESNPWHPHVLCVKCGQVSCLKRSLPMKDWTDLLPEGFELAEVLLRGCCRRCAQDSRGKE